jgi:hypothetical protein
MQFLSWQIWGILISLESLFKGKHKELFTLFEKAINLKVLSSSHIILWYVVM